MKRMLQVFAVLGTILALFRLGTPPVSAHGVELVVEPAQARSGETITVSGVEFPPHQIVTIVLVGTEVTVPLGETRAGADGTFSARWTIPDKTRPGAYILKADAQDKVLGVEFIVLRREGLYSAPVGPIIAAIVVVGAAALVGLSRRRKRRESRGVPR